MLAPGSSEGQIWQGGLQIFYVILLTPLPKRMFFPPERKQPVPAASCLAPACPGLQRSGGVAHPDLISQPAGCCSLCA